MQDEGSASVPDAEPMEAPMQLPLPLLDAAPQAFAAGPALAHS